MQTTRRASLTGDPAPGTGRRRRLLVLFAVAALVVALDQATKILAVTRLGDGQVVQIVGDVLRLRLVRNSGAAFSIATNMTLALTVVALVVVVVILRVSRRLTSGPWAVALGGFLGGALGNLGDRVLREPRPFHGHVVDFLELPNFPVFNLADSAIVGAAILVAWLSLRGVPYDAVPRSDAEAAQSGDAPDDAAARSGDASDEARP